MSEDQAEAKREAVVYALDCPFDTRLARTPYLVIPKLALQAMPLEWRVRFEALLQEADDAGLATPDYHVFRADPEYSLIERSDSEDEYSSVETVVVLQSDPWANYRHGRVEDLNPDFRTPSKAILP